MFFDFSQHKIFQSVIIFAVLIVGVGLFVISGPDSPVNPESMGIFLERTKSSFIYWWNYKVTAPENLKLLKTRDGLLALASDIFLGDTTYYYSARTEGIARSVPVLLYHGESYQSIALPNFIDHMHALKNAGWNTIGMNDLYVYIKDGKPLPDKSFLLTFDDGRKDSYYPTDPVLKDVGFKATMFVITAFSLPKNNLDSSFYLSPAELAGMQQSGRWEFGSHGQNDHSWYQIGSSTDQIGHFLSNKLWLPGWLGESAERRVETETEFRQRVAEDLLDSKKDIENSLGPAIGFAFPFNDYGQETVNYGDAKNIISELVPAAYQMAFYQTTAADGDTFNYPASEQYMLKRIEPALDWSGEKLIQVLEESRAKNLSYEQTGKFGDEWIRTWGTIVKDSKLSLSASKDSTGAAAFLNGSGWWDDYTFTTKITLRSGSDVSVMARYQDSKNFFMCTLSGARVVAEERINGASRMVSEGKLASPPKGEMELGVSVRGTSGDCLVNGQQISGGVITNQKIKNSGGIGMQVWDIRTAYADMSVSRVLVTER